MKQYLLLFDVDGTLYDPKQREVSPSTVAAIRQAKANGHSFVIASGRTHYALGKSIDALKPDFIIADCGAVVVDAHHRIIAHHDLTSEHMHALLTLAHEHDAGMIIKCLDHMYIYQNEHKIDWLEGQRNGDVGAAAFIHCPQQDAHLTHPVQCVGIHTDPLVVKAVLAKHPDLCGIPYSQDGFDIVRNGINKSVGLRDLMKYLQITPEQIICFGDNYNDIEMMKEAGYSVAMGNAIPQVKQIADYITTPCDEDGIAHALQHLGCL